MAFRGFEPSLFEFLDALADNNNRPWFQANKERYLRDVAEPCLALIRDFRPRLKRISKFFVASDRRAGGSLMRVYRDTRFAKDKTPYKTNVGIQFRHQLGRDVHAPGFYIHIASDECFLGAGMWRPDRTSLGQIRQAIATDGRRWQRARNDKKFRQYFQLAGGRLKRPPRGFPADHPRIEDLKRTDFIAVHALTEPEVLDKGLLDHVATVLTTSRPLMRFLCQAIKVPF